jgi:hypothetical protein
LEREAVAARELRSQRQQVELLTFIPLFWLEPTERLAAQLLLVRISACLGAGLELAAVRRRG